MKQILNNLLAENSKGCMHKRWNLSENKEIDYTCKELSKKEYGFFELCHDCQIKRQAIKRCFKIMAENELEFLERIVNFIDNMSAFEEIKERIGELKQVICECGKNG